MQAIAKILTEKYNIDAVQFFAVIECESGWRTDVQSNHSQSYGREESYGLAQWHLPDNPHITYEQAISPIFSLNEMAKEWSEGRQWRWSCYNNLAKK